MRYFKRPDGRVYTILDPLRDLLGDLVLVTIHGSERNARLGGVKTYPTADEVTAVKLETAIAKVRLRHGYIEQA